MMLGSVFAKTLRDNRKGLFWWSLGVIVFALINVAFYPDFKTQTQFNELLNSSDAIKAFAPNVTSFTSPEGYLNSQLFALMGPMLLIIYGVVQGTAAIAGEENRKTLPLLMSNPVSRERVILEKAAAILVSLTVLILVLLATMIIASPSFELNLGFDKFLAVHASLFLLAAVFGSLGLLLGAATGNRSAAAGITSTVAIGSYLLYTLAPIAKVLEPYQDFSPFYYYFQNDPLTNGLDLSHATVLLVSALVLTGLSVLAFRRRDLAT